MVAKLGVGKKHNVSSIILVLNYGELIGVSMQISAGKVCQIGKQQGYWVQVRGWIVWCGSAVVHMYMDPLFEVLGPSWRVLTLMNFVIFLLAL